MKARIDHIGIAVANIADALAFYRDVLGLEVERPEEVATERVRTHFIRFGDAPPRVKAERGEGAPGVKLELLEATSDDSPIAKYVAKRGPGIHHITLCVEDIAAALAQLKARGVRLIDDAPRPGAHGSQVAFIHPASAHGVLIELKQG
jgi:methylmalonyl-CoA/ethylmalonyl-CoA epimerase